jgi:Tfp pilus assembly PilM family ATPase
VVINDMILCGGGSGLRHLDHHLSSELELPVTIANPLAHVRAPSHREQDAQVVAPQLAVATGLALRTVA